MTLLFDDALAAIRNGARVSLCGSTLIVNGVTLAITDEQFEQAWDAMGPLDADDVIGLAS